VCSVIASEAFHGGIAFLGDAIADEDFFDGQKEDFEVEGEGDVVDIPDV
jgi:hypothetical protein